MMGSFFKASEQKGDEDSRTEAERLKRQKEFVDTLMKFYEGNCKSPT